MSFLHCTLACQDDRRIELAAIDVEGEFIGLSITSHDGLEFKRVAGELTNVKDIQALRDMLTAFLER